MFIYWCMYVLCIYFIINMFLFLGVRYCDFIDCIHIYIALAFRRTVFGTRVKDGPISVGASWRGCIGRDEWQEGWQRAIEVYVWANDKRNANPNSQSASAPSPLSTRTTHMYIFLKKCLF